MPNIKFRMCWPLNVIGAPDMIPLNFKKAIIDPDNGLGKNKISLEPKSLNLIASIRTTLFISSVAVSAKKSFAAVPLAAFSLSTLYPLVVFLIPIAETSSSSPSSETS